MEIKTIPIGTRFGRLTVVAYAFVQKNRSCWHCVCDCGASVTVVGKNLRTGNSESCGCLKIEKTKQTLFKHGLSKTLIDYAWKGMLARCYRATNPKFGRYGGRGILVCEFLRASPANLLALIGPKPPGRSSVGRANNDGHYSCGACAECFTKQWLLNISWETPQQQARNKSTTIRLAKDGVTKPLSEWAEQLGLCAGTMRSRIGRGLNPFEKVK